MIDPCHAHHRLLTFNLPPCHAYNSPLHQRDEHCNRDEGEGCDTLVFWNKHKFMKCRKFGEARWLWATYSVPIHTHVTYSPAPYVTTRLCHADRCKRPKYTKSLGLRCKAGYIDTRDTDYACIQQCFGIFSQDCDGRFCYLPDRQCPDPLDGEF